MSESSYRIFFMVDLDNFKNVNDKLGHIMGDKAITDTADKLTEIFHHNAYIGRLGGDEFAVCVKYIAFDKEKEYAIQKTYAMSLNGTDIIMPEQVETETPSEEKIIDVEYQEVDEQPAETEFQEEDIEAQAEDIPLEDEDTEEVEAYEIEEMEGLGTLGAGLFKRLANGVKKVVSKVKTKRAAKKANKKATDKAARKAARKQARANKKANKKANKANRKSRKTAQTTTYPQRTLRWEFDFGAQAPANTWMRVEIKGVRTMKA